METEGTIPTMAERKRLDIGKWGGGVSSGVAAGGARK